MQAASPGPFTTPVRPDPPGPPRTVKRVPTRTKLAARDPAFAPMLATLGTPPTGDGHAIEWKFDGQRATLVVDDDEVTVFSRNGADVSSLGVDVLVNGVCPCHGPESLFARRHTCRAPSGRMGSL